MKQKSILVRLLSVVCMICCCLSLVFGAAACSEPAAKAIKSISMNTNGDLVIIYTDDSTETVKNNKADVTVCAHEDTYVINSGIINDGAKIYVADIAGLDVESADLPADKCFIKSMKVCKDCDELIVEYGDHTEVEQNKPATCFEGSYTGVGCSECRWVKGKTNNDKIDHKDHMQQVENPVEFQLGLINAGKLPGDAGYKAALNPCKEEVYTDVKICDLCGYIEVATTPATGHTFNKEALTETKIANGTATYKVNGTCVDCGESVVLVELPSVNAEDAEYTIVSGGNKNNDGHYVSYVYNGTETIAENCKFEDGTTTIDFEDVVVTTDAFTAPHYIFKGEEKVEPYGKTLTDYAAGVYSKLYIDATAAPLTCDPAAAGSAATAICEFCNASVPTTVKIAHTNPEKAEDLVASYGADPCLTELEIAEIKADATKKFYHTETWNCTKCGTYEVEVEDYEHKWALSAEADAVTFNADKTVTLKMVCEYHADHKTTKTATDVKCLVEETCGTAGKYEYTDENGKAWPFDKPATGKHVYEAGKVVTYTTGNKVEYANAKEYINKSVFLASTNTAIVCGEDIDATLICPDCKQAVQIVINRAHALDEEHSQPAAQTCVGDAYSVKYCSYADCANVWKEDGTGVPYESGKLNARHSFVFDRIEGGKLYVKCTKVGCDAVENAIAIDTYTRNAEKSITGKECADYAKGECNTNVYNFSYAIAGNTAEDYEVTEKLAVEAHKYGVTDGMEVDPAATENAAAIIKASYLQATSAAEDCQHAAAYSYICTDCNLSVAITVKGDHINDDEVIVDASCEEAAYYNCDACGGKFYVEGSTALGHEATIEVNADGTIATITCDCGLNLTVATKAGLGTDRIATAGAAVNCEDCKYSYEYVSATVPGFKQTFEFVGKKIGGTSHTLLKVNGVNAIFCYVIVDGEAVVFDAEKHAGLTKYCGNYCTECGNFIAPPVA